MRRTGSSWMAFTCLAQVVLASAEMKSKLAPLGAEPAPMSPEDFARFVRAEIDKWAKVVKASGARAD